LILIAALAPCLTAGRAALALLARVTTTLSIAWAGIGLAIGPPLWPSRRH